MPQTTEALKTKVTGESGTVDLGRIFAVKGPQFYEDFVHGTIKPMRRETAMMYVCQVIGYQGQPVSKAERDQLIDNAWDFADAFTMEENNSLERNVAAYFREYCRKGDIEDIIKADIEGSKDYHL